MATHESTAAKALDAGSRADLGELPLLIPVPRAAQLLGAAGVRAIQRGDPLASNRLLERCRAMWRPAHATPREPLLGDV